MSLESNKIMNLADGKVLYDDLRNRIEDLDSELDDYIKEPTNEGTSGQVLTTDGNGGRVWTTVQGGGGGGSGTSNYNDLSNKPQIAGVTLLGNKSLSDLGIASATDISEKADKVSLATNGNFAGLDGNGNLTDSGKKPSDFALSTDVHSVPSGGSSGQILAKASGSNYDITWVDPSSGGGGGSGTSNYNDLSNKPQIAGVTLLGNKSLSDLGIASESAVSGKADKVSSATDGNFAGLDVNGNLTDSGYGPSDFAPASSLNEKISEPATDGTSGQVLTTDGNGGRSWTTVQGGAGSSNYNDLSNKPQINSITLTGNKSLSDLGIPTASDIIDDTVGDGVTTKTWSADKLYDLEQRIADLEYIPIEIVAFFLYNPLAEIGSSVASVQLSYSLSQVPAQAKLDDRTESVNTQWGVFAWSGSSMIRTNKTWTFQVADARMVQQEQWVTATATLTFTNKVLYGAAAVPTTLNDTFLNSLPTRTLSTTKIGNFSVTAGDGQYIWYALPTSYGECTFTVGGFTGGFSLISTQNHTNESGETVEYRIYRSDNANLGSTTVTVA